MKKMLQTPLACALTVVALAAPPLAASPREPLATTYKSPAAIDWQINVDHDGGTLTVSGPEGIFIEHSFAADENPTLLLDVLAQTLPDGDYSYQLSAAPHLDRTIRERLRRSQATGQTEDLLRELRQAGLFPIEPRVQSGFFSISAGAVVVEDLPEAKTGDPANRPATPIPVAKDDVINDDLIVIGSACIGHQCVENIAFGDDTIKLKETDLRIGFEDTSTATGHATHDWQLTANEAGAGGAEKFSLEDLTASTIPLTIQGSAPTDSIFVDSAGRVGLGTATPAVDLQVTSGNTPTLRLEQDTSASLSARSWDVSGNADGFTVRDVTNSSAQPFRIRAGARPARSRSPRPATSASAPPHRAKSSRSRATSRSAAAAAG
ncbi:MAG: hypothetical protein HC897_08175 [Thermoanaerobaculia bacterium]|nr:hypothetical protein [Thermoanaerobaculia bacterium]